MPGHLQPGIQARTPGIGRSALCGVRQRLRLLQPQFRQGRQALFVGQALDVRQGGDALGCFRLRTRAVAIVQTGNADRLHGRGAEPAAGQHVAALEGDVLAGRHRGDFHRRAELAQDRATVQQHQDGRQSRQPWVPALHCPIPMSRGGSDAVAPQHPTSAPAVPAASACVPGAPAPATRERVRRTAGRGRSRRPGANWPAGRSRSSRCGA